MTALLFCNNHLGLRVTEWLIGEGEQIAGLVVHPNPRRRFVDEIIATSRVPQDRIIDGSRLEDPAVQASIGAMHADLGLSVMFGYRIPMAVAQMFSRGCFNLHPAYLPFNRGADPNVWSIVDRTPAGTTLHWVDERIDTGDIVAQRKVDVEPVDTGESLYRKLEDASLDLFKECWPALRSGAAPRVPQAGAGSHHRRADLSTIAPIDLNREYRAGDLINLLRAQSFKPFPGAYFDDGGRRVRVFLELSYEDEVAPS